MKLYQALCHSGKTDQLPVLMPSKTIALCVQGSSPTSEGYIRVTVHTRLRPTAIACARVTAVSLPDNRHRITFAAIIPQDRATSTKKANGRSYGSGRKAYTNRAVPHAANQPMSYHAVPSGAFTRSVKRFRRSR